ncbi:DNA primase family protein [Loigolactobacillus zhaoyuanensis]|uniref:Phage/plasmid primase, P4 family n=1 Tax=Loigolactobacillus zhaoyuanensis TaxID=2486017 RepID=A0ABW8UBA0_9LACO
MDAKQQTFIRPAHDQELNLATATSRHEKKWKNKPMTWGDFLQKLQTPVVTPETLEEFLKLSKSRQDDIKDVGGFVGGFLKEGRRKANYVQSRSILTLDVDFATPTLIDDIQLLFDCEIAIYSTHKHKADKPRYRLIIPLKRVVTPDEYQPVARKVAELFGMDLFDDTTYQPERLMYWPSHSSNGEYLFKYFPGDWLDPDEVLAQYDNWRDATFWPESSRKGEIHVSDAKKQGDPLTKKGIIGAFNRTYDIRSAIEKFLPDIYTPTDHEDRFTYAEGSTEGGLVLYDDKFAYSHHGTDPVGDTLNNAFDLVRKQLFGDRDDSAKEGISPTKLPSYKAMIDFINDDKAVMAQYSEELTGDAQQDFNDTNDKSELEDWLSISLNGQPVINTYVLAQHVLDDVPLYYNGHEFLWYDDKTGIWRDGAEDFLKGHLTNKYLKKLTKISPVRESIAAAQGSIFKTGKFPDSDLNKLVLKNGVYDITTNEFTAGFDPDIYARTGHPIQYDAAATAPLFDGFVKYVVGEENAPFIYEWFGYCLYRRYSIQKMLFLYGKGGTGKSTLLNLAKDMIGAESYSAVSLEALMTKNFAAANLYQKTANFDTDAKPEFLGDASILKSLTGEDTLYADVKFAEPLMFYNFAKLTFAMNDLPPMRDFSGGLERRAIILRTPNKVTSAIKKQYPLKKMRLEIPGIFNAAMNGLRRALKQGHFTETKAMRAELDNWLRGNDQVGRFIDDICEIDKKAKTPVEDLYNALDPVKLTNEII